MRRSGALPGEMVLEVREALLTVVTFAEFVKLGAVCRGWQAWRDATFTRWLRAQVIGRPLATFSGSAGERRFLVEQATGQWMRIRKQEPNGNVAMETENLSLVCLLGDSEMK